MHNPKLAHILVNVYEFLIIVIKETLRQNKLDSVERLLCQNNRKGW